MLLKTRAIFSIRTKPPSHSGNFIDLFPCGNFLWCNWPRCRITNFEALILIFFPYFFFRLTSPDVCLYKPCKNGGTCDSDYINGNYTCDCPDGFYGDTCRLGKWAKFFFFFSLVFDMHHNIHRYEVVINVCEWIGWNPIWSEIKHVHFLKRTGRPWSGESDLFINNTDSDKIGWHNVFLTLK